MDPAVVLKHAGDLAVDDDVAGGLIGRGAGLRGEIAGAVGVDLGAVEDGSGVAEDEVDSTFDVGVEVVLAAVVGEEGVLMAEEAAVLEDGAVGADSDGDGLTSVSGGVFKGDVVGLEARPLTSTVSVKKVPPACFALRLLVITTSAGDLPLPMSVMLGWFWVTMTRSL